MTLPITFAEFPAFLMVMVRVTAILVTIPLLGERMVPRMVKVAMALLLASMLYPSVGPSVAANLPDQPLAWLPALTMEGIFGAVIGFSVRLLTAAFEFAGEIAGYVLGLSMAQALDPQTQLNVPIVGQFLTVLAFLIFLAMDAHHLVIGAIVHSFEWLPPFGVAIGPNFADLLIDLAFQIFKTGLQIAAPMVAAILLANVGLGVISRAVPQMHVLIVAMPMTIAMGFLVLGMSLPYIATLIQSAYAGLNGTFLDLFIAMRA